MYDSVTHNFDRVSDYSDSGSTPLQGQQDEQLKAVNSGLHGQQIHMTYATMMKLFMIEIEKRYKMNYIKTHQSKLKTISPI